MEEKRQSERSDLNLKVSWKGIHDTLNNTSQNITKNISGDGICLILDEKLNIGDILDLEIEFSEKNIVFSKGLVAWIDSPGAVDERQEIKYCAGIEFLNLDGAVKKVIYKLINKSPAEPL